MWSKSINVAVCTLNNWALDFEGNVERIIKTCKEAYEKGAKIRVGAELEITGYSCLDHFNELDTEMFAWDGLKRILEASKQMKDLLIITGMPIRHKLALYNCAVSLAEGNILFIRAKKSLCDDGVYREGRHFNSWKKEGININFPLPQEFNFEQKSVSFGDGIMMSKDGIKVGFEICEELWTNNNPSSLFAVQNVDVICNLSASYHVLSKSAHRLNQLLLGTTKRLGGIYLYSNFRGCDGERVFFDGMSSIVQNGKLYAQIEQFDIEDTCTVNAILDINETRNYRQSVSSNRQMSTLSDDVDCILIPIYLLDQNMKAEHTSPMEPKILTECEELALGPPAFMWHYLRRSRQAGYFIPLSGKYFKKETFIKLKIGENNMAIKSIFAGGCFMGAHSLLSRMYWRINLVA